MLSSRSSFAFLTLASIFFASSLFAYRVVVLNDEVSTTRLDKMATLSSSSTLPGVDTVKSLLRSMRSLAQVSRKQNLFRLGRWTVMQTRTYALNMGFWVPHDPVVS
ncbi:uncharacterized protein LOC122317465 [Carya illinoinensis]|uniref:Uncharacterized protein n=1 Tax=Carya illinoinensis TaxID=32201 RepID=A0A8T1PWZ8_CARIL|nr:uncharacterized protein LOC122317465 [Carya illinoinensis]KAG6646728.1 hypothetical protein CIPAW_07G028000 [Carya illinoinensis]